MSLWGYADYRDTIGSLGIPSEEDVRNEMAMDAALEEVYYYFGDDLPEEWQSLTSMEILEKWHKYKKARCEVPRT